MRSHLTQTVCVSAAFRYRQRHVGQGQRVTLVACGGALRGYRVAMARQLLTGRLALRPWTADDAAAALGAYGDAQVARWLAPAMDRVQDPDAMRLVLQQWVAEDARMLAPAGRWAIELRQDQRLIGGATLLPLPPDEEFEIGWQLHPDAWGHGYATETGLALARWAFEQGIEQVIAVVRPANTRAVATVRRIGMEWVGETEKYHNLRLQVFRLRPGDLATPPR
jgi:RimJ/RimL family protein N-acetyltransferase